MIIVGAGLAGLLAGQMLKHRNVVICEKQLNTPNNHSAVLRFRSSIVGDVTRIPFKKVNMIKSVLPWHNPVADALSYSYKNTGFYRSDRSILAGTVSAERYIAPPDLIGRMAQDLDIQFNTDGLDYKDRPKISTVPMPVLMKVLEYPHRDQADFKWLPGVNVSANLPFTDAYISLLVPHPNYEFSRISITGQQLIIECPMLREVPEPDEVDSITTRALRLLGMNNTYIQAQAKKQTYAKILPIEEGLRKDFIYWATKEHDVYSLGRFATWRPGLLLDDLVKDIQKIEKWHWEQDHYSRVREK